MRGSGVRILFAAPIKTREIKHISDASVLARYFAVAIFVPEQCVGRACESTIKISKGKHIRVASVRARGFAVAALVQNNARVGTANPLCAPSKKGFTRRWRWQKPVKTIRAPHTWVP